MSVVVEALPPEICQMCGEEHELRPYGLGGLWVCFRCAMKNPRVAEAAFEAQFEEGE